MGMCFCGKEFQSAGGLRSHLKRVHNTKINNVQKIKDIFGVNWKDFIITEISLSKYFGKLPNKKVYFNETLIPFCEEYFYKNGVLNNSRLQCIKHFIQYFDKNWLPAIIEYLDYKKEHQEAVSWKHHLLFYGEIEGKKKFEKLSEFKTEFFGGDNNKVSLKSLTKKLGSKSLAKDFLKKKGQKGVNTKRDNGWFDDISNNPFSKEFWLKRGFTLEEAQQIVNDRNHWLKENPSKKESDYRPRNPMYIEYWIDKGYSLKEYTEFRKIKSPRYFEYWENLGFDDNIIPEKISEYIIKSTQGFHNGNKSKKADELFLYLSNYLINDNIIFSYKDKKEFILFNEEKRAYKYDFTDLSSKKIIEFNGDYWHANPEKYKVEDFIKFPGKGEKTSVKELWEHDMKKIITANKHGFDVLVIWETEYKNDKEGTIQKCLEFLRGGLNNEI